MQQFTKEQLMALNPKQVYRHLLKNIKYYPSKNRFEMMLTIKEGM